VITLVVTSFVKHFAQKLAIITFIVATPTAAFAAAPGGTADVIDAVPMSTVLDPSDPAVDVKVTNSSGKEVTLRGWLNGEPATAAVPVRSQIVKLEFPAMTEGQATLKLSLTAEGIADVAEHRVLVANAAAAPQPNVSTPAKPEPGASKAPKPRPSWSKWPKPSSSPSHSPTASPSELPKTGDSVSSFVALGGGSLLLGALVIGLAWAMGRRTRMSAR
jgi:LPXTG-motif cell wall-anchored protein